MVCFPVIRGGLLLFRSKGQRSRIRIEPALALYSSFRPKGMKIIRVNGENGAQAFQMAPNSSALLLDETAPIVWFVQTDGAGYKTAKPFSIAPYQPQPPVDVHALEARINRLEALINESNPANDAAAPAEAERIGE